MQVGVSVSDDFLSRNTEPRAEIIGGVLREGQLGALAGPFGVGKTPLLSDLVIHVVNGISWCGREVARRPVITIDLESDGPSYKKRLRDISHRLEVPNPAVPEGLEVYLEHDAASEPATAKLLAALASKDVTARVAFLEEALQRKPDALLIMDPIELYFRFDTRDKMHVLGVYRCLRGILCRFPKSAMLATFNLRKRDRRMKKGPDLLVDVRSWLEEICGSLDLLNRCDVRLGLDLHDEEIRVFNGIRRGEEMEPTLIRPAYIGADQPAGFELCPPNALAQQFAFTTTQLKYWHALPNSFRFEEIADQQVPRSTLSRLLKRAKSLGLVVESDGLWTKCAQ